MALNTKENLFLFFAHFHSFLFFVLLSFFRFFLPLHKLSHIYLFMVGKQRGRLIRLLRVDFFLCRLVRCNIQLEFIKSLNLQIFLCALSMLCTNLNDAFELGLLHETKRFHTIFHFIRIIRFELILFSVPFSISYPHHFRVLRTQKQIQGRIILIAFYLFPSWNDNSHSTL